MAQNLFGGLSFVRFLVFSGGSGDGMQLAGVQFAAAVAQEGSDIVTLPGSPSEIRAPAVTISGVSGLQVNFGINNIHVPGDQVDVLVEMTPKVANVDDINEEKILVHDAGRYRFYSFAAVVLLAA